jgi:hypothetical protein
MLLSLVSCNKKNNTEETNSVINKVNTGNSLIKGARNIAAESEALKKIKPIDIETLKAFFPETINGLPKTNSNAIDMAGASTAFATYGQNTSKQINIQLIDGAGEKGAAATGVFRAIKYDNTNNEKENGDYNKIKKYEDNIIRENYNKSLNRHTLTFFYKNRFAIKLKVTGFNQKDIWNIFKEFNVKSLIK